MKKRNKNFIYLFLLLIVIIILCIFSYKNVENIENNQDFGFILTRHVEKPSHNDIWTTCVKRIREFYPTTKIVIIDNESKKEILNNKGLNLDNCIIIDSKFKGAGELVPYYYFYYNKWFQKAIYIHDSVFINGKIDISNVYNVKFLWFFEPHYFYDNRPYIIEFLSYLNYSDELIALFDSNRWVGCFGVMTVMDHSYLKKIFAKYNLFILFEHVNQKIHRLAMERILALICFHDKALNEHNASIYGNFQHMQGFVDKLNYESYMAKLENNEIESSPTKLFIGRN